MAAKTSYKTFTIAVPNSRIDFFNASVLEIKKMVAQKVDIPYQLVSNIIGIMFPPGYFENDIHMADTSRIHQKAMEYFSAPINKGSYDFDGLTDADIPEDKFYEQYSLSYMVYLAVFKYYRTEVKGNSQEKDTLIQFFHKEITEYANSHFSKLHLKEFTHYKQAVIAGFLAHLVGGFKISISKKRPNNNPITKREIYNFAKNALSKI